MASAFGGTVMASLYHIKGIDVVKVYNRQIFCLVRIVPCAVLRCCRLLARAVALCCAFSLAVPGLLAAANFNFRIPILVYHRFATTAADSMTVTVSLFESHLKYLRDNGYQTISLRQFVEFRANGHPALPPRAIIITADDGHRSVFTQMLPLARKYSLPVALFIYPSAISNADYAMTWEQLLELKQTGLFDIQSHSYWHPNFKTEKQRLNPEAYKRFVRHQLGDAKNILERKIGVKVDSLAWPFGIFDDELMSLAADAGYTAGFAIEGRHATARDPMLAMPRYLMTQTVGMKLFAGLIDEKNNSTGRRLPR
jgi:peptidoglycan/xylan/chitin deacetylase (PgdA/CDA1 family)